MEEVESTPSAEGRTLSLGAIRGRRIVGALCALLVLAYVALPLFAWFTAGRVAGPQSFTRPVIFALLGWAAYSGRGWARWFLVVVCAVGAAWWAWDGGQFMDTYPGLALILVAGAGGLGLMSLVLVLSDDVSEHFADSKRLRAASARKYSG